MSLFGIRARDQEAEKSFITLIPFRFLIMFDFWGCYNLKFVKVL